MASSVPSRSVRSAFATGEVEGIVPTQALHSTDGTAWPQPEGFKGQASCFWRNEDHCLVVSPYSSNEHLLNLCTLDQPDRFMAVALQALEPVRCDFATCSYPDAFNWPHVMEKLASISAMNQRPWRRQEFYVVIFRSQLQKEIDVELLFALDKQSHAEAMASGGLLKYWYGKPDLDRRNLATCVWRNREDAIKGGQGPWHKRARSCIPKMYEHISVTGIQLVVDEGLSKWYFESIHPKTAVRYPKDNT